MGHKDKGKGGREGGKERQGDKWEWKGGERIGKERRREEERREEKSGYSQDVTGARQAFSHLSFTLFNHSQSRTEVLSGRTSLIHPSIDDSSQSPENSWDHRGLNFITELNKISKKILNICYCYPSTLPF